MLRLSFVSGLTGLVYEVVWAKDLALSLGGTAAAQAVVLAAFLGGLAAGAALLGRKADEASSALGFYARVEFAVAAAALLAPLLLRAVGLAGAARFPAAFLVVFGPAFLMGASLPALTRAAGQAGGGAERALAGLYAANCAGAVAGTLLAAFALVPLAGLDGATLAAAALSAWNGLAARRLAGAPAAAPRKVRPEPAREDADRWAPGVYAVVFAAGLVSLCFEAAWTRALAMAMGPTTYSFAVMLAGFIGGLALGGWLAARPRARELAPETLLSLALLGVAASAATAPAVISRLPFWFRLARDAASSFHGFEARKLLLAGAAMLPLSTALGLILPAAARLVRLSGAEGRGVGAVFAANTLGNVAGAAAALYLLPALGLRGLLAAGAAVCALLAGAAWTLEPSAGRGRRLAGLAAGAALGLALHPQVPPLDALLLAVGSTRGREGAMPHDYAAYRRAAAQGLRLLSHEDGAEATVDVLRADAGVLALNIDGKTDASTGQDMHTQLLLGHVPMFLRPDARAALVVGLGSGATAGAVLSHPVSAVDVVELSPEVARASRLFEAANGRALSDPRLRLHLTDGRALLARSDRVWDVIVSEPSNPWMAGVANLFTREFYELAERRLAPGGLMVQWFHVYEMDDARMSLVLRTFRSVFPHVTVWNLLDSDIILVGSRDPLEPDFPAMERRLLEPRVRESLGQADVVYLSSLLSLQSQTDATAAELAGTGPLNRDRFPRLESGAPKALFARATARLVRERNDRLNPDRRGGLYLERYLAARGRKLLASEYLDSCVFPRAAVEKALALACAEEWSAAYPADRRAKEVLASVRQW